MTQVNMHEAKTRLSQLVKAIESGRESQVIIARHGKPIARLVSLDSRVDTGKRIGIAKGRFVIPEPAEETDREVAQLFLGGTDSENSENDAAP